MKLSDKALRQIKRELLGRRDDIINQDESQTTTERRALPTRGMLRRARSVGKKATVLPFKKRLR